MPEALQAIRYRPDPALGQIADFIGDPVRPATFPQAILRWRGDRAAAEVGLDTLDDAAWLDHFARFVPLPDNFPGPLALRYHGHQFGVYNPDLGDGRGFTFAQLRDGQGRLLDLGTKGSGLTPWSRTADGRLTLKGAVRELLATEMLEALGVITSRTFSIVETGEALERHDEPSPTRGAVLVRMSHGHIRIGSFQRLAALGLTDESDRLARYVLTQLYGEDADTVAALSAADAAVALLDRVVARTADLAARYMVAGFVHGVLNSDNINVTGESFDYGPWRFNPRWDPGFVAAYFDHGGRYAFARQPGAIHWNCGQLAAALRPLADAEPLVACLERYAPRYQAALARQFLWRLGVASLDANSDLALVGLAEQVLITDAPPIDAFFRDWATGRTPPAPLSPAAQAFADALARHAPVEGRGDVPDCSMLIDEVEAIWAAIAGADDWQPLTEKIAAVRALGAALGPPPPPIDAPRTTG